MHPDFKKYCYLLLGQTISMLGSTLTTFALSVWVFRQNESVIEFSMIVIASIVPMALLSPFAGNLADKYNRKTILMIGQTVAVLITAAMAYLYWSEKLSVNYIILLTIIGTSFNALVLPAIQASITLLVPADDLNKANGMFQLASGLIKLIAPALAGYLMVSYGMKTIFIIDFITFAVGVISLALTKIPQPETSVARKELPNESAFEKITFSVRYLKSKPGLLALTLVSAGVYLAAAGVFILIPPLVLSFSDEMALGSILSSSGIGVIIGSLIVISYNNPQQRFSRWVMFSTTYISCGFIVFTFNANITVMSVIAALTSLGVPIWLTCDQTLIQKKCAIDVQGRIFGFRNFLFTLSPGFAIALVGPLSDYVFEPLMQPGQYLAEHLGGIFGVGKGRGIALMIALFGTFGLVVTLIGWCIPAIRQIDTALPSYDPVSNQTAK